MIISVVILYCLFLSSDVKRLVYRMTGFDEKYYSKLLRGKKSVLFAMSFYTSIFAYYGVERRAIRRIREGKFPQVDRERLSLVV